MRAVSAGWVSGFEWVSDSVLTAIRSHDSETATLWIDAKILVDLSMALVVGWTVCIQLAVVVRWEEC